MSTSRERILNALSHKSGPIPVDFGGHRSSGIAAIAYAKLKRALGISSGDIYVHDVMGQLALIEPEVLDALGGDTVDWAFAFSTSQQDWKEWTLPDGTPCKIPAYLDVRSSGGNNYIHNIRTGECRAVQVNGALTFDRINAPFASHDLSDGVDKVFEMWADGSMEAAPPPGNHFMFTPEGMPDFTEHVRALRQSTQRAVIGIFGGCLFEITHWLFGMENDFVQMSANPDEYEQLVHRIGDEHAKNLETWLRHFGKNVDVVLFVDDYGGQQGPLISTEMYRRYFKPVHKRLWNLVHTRSTAKVNLHCCGGIDPLLPDMIDAGVDAINPVQITCEGMDAASLKRKHGSRVTLWGGGCDTRDILPRATPAQIREHVLRQCDILAPGGGFVFQQVHNIMANIPPENVISMFDAVKEFNAGRPGA